MRHGVRKILPVVVLLSGTLVGQTAKSEAPKTVGQILDQMVAGVEREFVPAAEAMPEDKYSFAPTNGEFKGVRTFAQQVKHVAVVNYLMASAVLGEKTPLELHGSNGPDSIKTKDEILKLAQDSFAYLHRAAASVNTGNETDVIKSPFGNGNTTRLTMAASAVSHTMDHYGQMVEYLRMNGIIPAASRH